MMSPGTQVASGPPRLRVERLGGSPWVGASQDDAPSRHGMLVVTRFSSAARCRRENEWLFREQDGDPTIGATMAHTFAPAESWSCGRLVPDFHPMLAGCPADAQTFEQPFEPHSTQPPICVSIPNSRCRN